MSNYPVCYDTRCPENCIYHPKVGDSPFIRGEKETELAFLEKLRRRRLRT